MATIRTAVKGEETLIPAYYCSPKGEGWCKAIIIEDGITIALSSVEKNNNGLYIKKTDLVKLLAALNRKECITLEIDK